MQEIMIKGSAIVLERTISIPLH